MPIKLRRWQAISIILAVFLSVQFLIFTIPQQPAEAATYTWSGALSSNTALFNFFNCGTPTGSRNYSTFPFQVSTNGNYTISITSASGMPGASDDAALALYSPSYNPASFSANCLAVNDDGNGNLPVLTIALSANIQYVAVVYHGTLGDAAGAGYSGQIMGPGEINQAPPTGSGFQWDDDRINNAISDQAAPVAIYYSSTTGISIYAIDPTTSAGRLIIRITNDEIEEVGIPDSQDYRLLESKTIQETGMPIRVYRTSSGQFQVNTYYSTGKTYNFAWDQKNGEKFWLKI
jgi:hypothetical protein